MEQRGRNEGRKERGDDPGRWKRRREVQGGRMKEVTQRDRPKRGRG